MLLQGALLIPSSVGLVGDQISLSRIFKFHQPMGNTLASHWLVAAALANKKQEKFDQIGAGNG
jgi:hypothetical protein